MPQQPVQRRRPNFAPLIVLVVVVGLIAGGFWLFRDRLSGNVTNLQVGDCFDEPTAARVFSDIQHQPCNQPHYAEVVVLVTDPAPRDAPYPGDPRDHFLALAFAQCLPAAATFLGTAIDNRSELDVGYFYPTPEGWPGGDRQMTCYLYREDDVKLTSSLRNSGPGPT